MGILSKASTTLQIHSCIFCGSQWTDLEVDHIGQSHEAEPEQVYRQGQHVQIRLGGVYLTWGEDPWYDAVIEEVIFPAKYFDDVKDDSMKRQTSRNRVTLLLNARPHEWFYRYRLIRKEGDTRPYPNDVTDVLTAKDFREPVQAK